MEPAAEPRAAQEIHSCGRAEIKVADDQKVGNQNRFLDDATSSSCNQISVTALMTAAITASSGISFSAGWPSRLAGA